VSFCLPPAVSTKKKLKNSLEMSIRLEPQHLNKQHFPLTTFELKTLGTLPYGPRAMLAGDFRQKW
jgi:hypothetical protein